MSKLCQEATWTDAAANRFLLNPPLTLWARAGCSWDLVRAAVMVGAMADLWAAEVPAVSFWSLLAASLLFIAPHLHMNVWVWSWKQFLTLSANHRAREDNGGSLGDKSWLSGGWGGGQVEDWWRDTGKVVTLQKEQTRGVMAGARASAQRSVSVYHLDSRQQWSTQSSRYSTSLTLKQPHHSGASTLDAD